jgi:hypothetical protein
VDLCQFFLTYKEFVMFVSVLVDLLVSVRSAGPDCAYVVKGNAFSCGDWPREFLRVIILYE